MKAALIINSKAKLTDRKKLRQIYAALAKTDLEIVEFIENKKITISQFAAAASLDGFDMVIAAGGDGTISAVATKLVGSNTALGVLPLGTYNNFAKDLGVPLDLEQAVQNLVSGTPKLIDVGEVNGHHFINNSSIGLYPHLVIRRERKESQGVPRILATAAALLGIFRKFPYYSVKLQIAGVETIVETPLLFLGNGHYDYDGLDIGERDIPLGGKLSILVLKEARRWHIAKLSVKALFGKIRQDKHFVRHIANEAWITLPKALTFVAKDGEVLRMKSPLHYQIKPKSLKVILPK